MSALLGPGKYSYSVDLIGNRVLSAGERLDVFVPHFEAGKQDALFARLDKERFRLGVEICFCSPLGDCWTLTAPAKQPAKTDEVGSCPKSSASTFKR
jgi:hypothetical protein